MEVAIRRSTDSRRLSLKSVNDVFENYLRNTPLAYALHRAAEAKHLGTIPMLRPVLDLGCGAGDFARFALENVVEVGLDISATRLARAGSTGCYVHRCLADGRRMPFAAERFQTVLAVSVLEHIAEPQPVLAEVNRILQPGGLFVGTVVLAGMYEELCYPRLLRWIGLAGAYVRAHKLAFAHRCLLEAHQWEEMFCACGFEPLAVKKVVSPRLTWYYDLLLVLAWPYALLRGCRCPGVWHPGWYRRLAQSFFLPILAEEETDGSSLFFVMRKRKGHM